MADTTTTVSKNSHKGLLGRFNMMAKSGSPWLSAHATNLGILLYIVVAIVAAQVSLTIRPIVGVYINAAAFAALIGLGLWKERARQLSISAAILPVVNMVSMSLPQSSTFARITVFYVGLLILGMLYRFLFTLDAPLTSTSLSALGYARFLPVMVVIGEALGVLSYVLLRHHYSFDHTSLPLVAVASVVFAVAEETFFRGLIQQQASGFMNPFLAVLISAVLYIFTSIGHVTILFPIMALITGLVISYVYYKKQNLLLTITLNAASKLVYVGLMASFIFR